MKKAPWATLIFLFGIISLGLFPVIHSLVVNVNPSVFTITSPSMEPTLNIGDLVFVNKINASRIVASETNGDIVVIKGPQYYFDHQYPKQFLNVENNTPIIHRVVEKYWNPNDSLWYFVTKGDANSVVDGALSLLNSSEDGNFFIVGYNSSNAIRIPETEIIGKVYFAIPFVGYFQIYSIEILSILGVLFVFFLIINLLKIEISIKIYRMDRSVEIRPPKHSDNEQLHRN